MRRVRNKLLFFKWFVAVVFKHGWWKFHPKDWGEIKRSKDKLTQKLVHFDALPEMYRKKGMKIHGIKCKICGRSWYTTYPEQLCNNLVCWIKYYA
jgi:hypothetical protein